jgi:tetratricopeptide (TPR) repeat protein
VTVSLQGLWLRMRPTIGRARRKALARNPLGGLSGQPNSEMSRPLYAPRAKVLFWCSVALQKSNRYKSAAGALEKAVAIDNRYSEWFYRLGNVRRYLGRWDQAVDAYESSLELSTRLARTHFWLAVARCHADAVVAWDFSMLMNRDRRELDADAAERVMEYAQHQPISEPRFVFWLGVSAQYWGQSERAVQLMSRAVEMDSGNWRWFSQLANAKREVGDWRGSVQAYESALALSLEEDSPSERLSLKAAKGDPAWVIEIARGQSKVDNWAASAAFHSLTVDRRPDDHRSSASLGISMMHLRDWEGAVPALAKALRLGGESVLLLDHLSVAHRHLGNWLDVADACSRGIAIEPNGSRFFNLAIAYQHLEKWEESSTAFERAVALHGWSRSWVTQLGAIRVAGEDWVGAAALYRLAIDSVDDPRYLFWLGSSLEKLEDWSGAVAAYEMAVEADDSNANWFLRLGYAYEHSGPNSIRNLPHIGLVEGTGHNLDRAAAAYERAIFLDPDRAACWSRLANAREMAGDFQGAVAAFSAAVTLAPDKAQHKYRLGRAVSFIANQRGVYKIKEHDEVERLYSEVLLMAPGHSSARQQLVRSSIKAGRWAVASESAWYPTPTHGSSKIFEVLRSYLESVETPESVEDLHAVLNGTDYSLGTVPEEWWFPLHWRLLSEGHFTLGYRAKTMMAKRIAASRVKDPDTNPGRYLEKARAMNFLGRVDEALEHLDTTKHLTTLESTRQAMEKMAADIAMSHGDMDDYLALNEAQSSLIGSDAEAQFREITHGRSIAIVGPADTNAEHGELIDSADVVVRTKFVSDSMDGFEVNVGSRTDLSYYALGSANFLKSDIVDALSRGELKMAVFRTETFDHSIPFLHRPGDVRYSPSEYQGSFRSAQFAIQRIIYDLLRYGPSSITVFNIDFFVAPDNYRPGYLADYTKDFSDAGMTQILSAFGHDFLADFVFTQRMHKLGFIQVDDEVAKLLAMTPVAYLQALDRT